MDGIFQFDFGPDSQHHVLGGNDLSAVEHLIFTHSHTDHLYPGDLAMRVPPYAHGQDRPLSVYGNDRVVARLGAALGDVTRLGLELHQIEPFQAVAVGDATLVPLIADHDRHETCLIHLFGHEGRWLLYGHDTGYLPETTWAFLGTWAAAGGRLDVAFLDCTNGPGEGMRFHMGLGGGARVRERLLDLGAARGDTRFVLTHFSHNGGLLHEELVERAGPLGFEVAYDGMEIQAL